MAFVKLNPSEIELAKRLATRRYKSNREAGVEDKKIGPQSDYVTDLQGMLAELAAAKYLNVYPDLLIETSAGGVDMVVPTVGTVDVKATTYEDGQLLIPKWKQDRDHADMYLLVIVTNEKELRLQMAGYVWAENVFHAGNLKDLGYGETFAIEQERLRPVDEIKKAQRR